MQPQEIEVIERHTQALIALTEAMKKDQFPIAESIWGAETCAAYFGVSKEYFAQYVASKPGFPLSAKIGHRKWIAQQVIDWAFSHWNKQKIRRKSKTSTD